MIGDWCAGIIVYLFSIDNTLFKLGLLYFENMILGNFQ